jgi:hypothetical protein
MKEQQPLVEIEHLVKHFPCAGDGSADGGQSFMLWMM